MAIFTCLNFYDEVPELASQSITVICIFLPLSAIWAGLVASDSSVGGSGPDSHQRLFKNEFYRSSSTSTKGYGEKSHLTGNTFGSGKEPESPRSHHYHQTKDSVDNGIYMQKEWHVEAGEPSELVAREV
ncbi:pheromone alpha factor receptor [Paraconiothyrium brasiliense]|uniref:Pheromone alpha factor receptor n=1 Tax=Paraconiothyrium brasiliense TaxID=300254 RepID=A0ABR3QN23_9PLEO